MAADCGGVEVFSLTRLFLNCPGLNGVLDAAADGDLNIAEKSMFICLVDSTDGANTVGFVSDF